MKNKRESRGFSLIEILIVAAIILILSAIYLPRLTGGRDPLSGKKRASPVQKAHQVSTVSYISQIQQAINMYKMDNEDRLPQNLQELKRYGVTEEMLMDSASGKPLQYNPQTGEITNPMPLLPPKN
jgi:prepilin-type N-terminal cleavage/methylation domain-containing protein